MLWHVFILFSIYDLIKTQDENEETTEIIVKSCREKNQLIGADNTEKYELIQIEINETLILECHYCGENDNGKSKNWYKIDLFNITPHEVHIDMHQNESLNRILISLDHELTIHHVTYEDSGIYYCRSLQDDKSDIFLNYIIEISLNITKKIEKGDMLHWKEYHDDYMFPMNKKFLTSNASDYLFIRQILSTTLEIITHWEEKVRPCEVCGRPQGEGIQEKYGFCRIKIKSDQKFISNLSFLNSELPENLKNKTETLKYFLNLPQVPCDSSLLRELFPSISQITESLSDFILINKCDGVCNPDATGVNQGWKFGSSKKFKYRRTIVLKEGEHLTLVCPESNLDNIIIWRRNGKVLKQTETVTNIDTDLDKIHVVVDAFNSLYLRHVTPKESGNYTCQVDDIRMQQIRIYVKSNSRLLNEAFARHMMYLGFILILSSSCYCAGCIAAFSRRKQFKDYSQIKTSGYICDCKSQACHK